MAVVVSMRNNSALQSGHLIVTPIEFYVWSTHVHLHAQVHVRLHVGLL